VNPAVNICKNNITHSYLYAASTPDFLGFVHILIEKIFVTVTTNLGQSQS
jgi:hypothetical protein